MFLVPITVLPAQTELVRALPVPTPTRYQAEFAPAREVKGLLVASVPILSLVQMVNTTTDSNSV